MKEKITNVSRPISSSTVQNATGRTTVAGAMSASHGEMEKMAKTPDAGNGHLKSHGQSHLLAFEPLGYGF